MKECGPTPIILRPVKLDLVHPPAPLQTGESPEARPIPFFCKPGRKIILGQEADAQMANEVATSKTIDVRVICSNRCSVEILG